MVYGRRGVLMASALDLEASGPGSSPGRGHCVVFLGKTLYSHSASLHQVYKWVPASLMLAGNPAMDQHPIQGGVEILLVASRYGNRDKHRPGGPHWPVCRLYLLTTWFIAKNTEGESTGANDLSLILKKWVCCVNNLKFYQRFHKT